MNKTQNNKLKSIHVLIKSSEKLDRITDLYRNTRTML
jgi:hypothetical protein